MNDKLWVDGIVIATHTKGKYLTTKGCSYMHAMVYLVGSISSPMVYRS